MELLWNSCFYYSSSFGPDRAQRSIFNLLTDYRINLFRQFVNKNQRIVHGQGAVNINYSTVIFNFNVCRLS